MKNEKAYESEAKGSAVGFDSGRTSCGISSERHSEHSRRASCCSRSRSAIFRSRAAISLSRSLREEDSGAGCPSLTGDSLAVTFTLGSSDTGVRILSSLPGGVGNFALSSFSISSFVTFTPLLSFVKVGCFFAGDLTSFKIRYPCSSKRFGP